MGWRRSASDHTCNPICTWAASATIRAEIAKALQEQPGNPLWKEYRIWGEGEHRADLTLLLAILFCCLLAFPLCLLTPPQWQSLGKGHTTELSARGKSPWWRLKWRGTIASHFPVQYVTRGPLQILAAWQFCLQEHWPVSKQFFQVSLFGRKQTRGTALGGHTRRGSKYSRAAFRSQAS